MHERWLAGTAGAMATLLSLAGCAWFESGPANLTVASSEECNVLTTALDKLAGDWRTNPAKDKLQVDAYAISADRIDSDYDSRLSGFLPPKGVRPVNFVDCGTPLATVSNQLDVVWPDHPIPTGDRRSCWRSDGGWISRAGIDADRTHAAVLYSDNVCGERSWLVRLTKDYRGVWIADAPDPLMREAVVPSQSG
jgi:hypothetical protein